MYLAAQIVPLDVFAQPLESQGVRLKCVHFDSLPQSGGQTDRVVAEVGSDVQKNGPWGEPPLEFHDLPFVLQARPEQRLVLEVGRVQRPLETLPDDVDIHGGARLQQSPELGVDPPFSRVVRQAAAVKQQRFEDRGVGIQAGPLPAGSRGMRSRWKQNAYTRSSPEGNAVTGSNCRLRA